MEEKEEVKKVLPPYLSYKTFRNFIDSMRVGMPNRVDRSLMGSMGGSVQALLILALEYLHLVTPKIGIPEEKLNQLVKADGPDRQKILKEIIVSSYTFLFVDGFDLKGATLRELQECFGQAGASGDTLRKCIAFFLNAAKDAGMKISPHIKTKRGPRIGSKQKKKINPTQEQINILDNQETPSSNLLQSPSEEPKIDKILLEKLLEKYPSFNPEWSAEVQLKWFDGWDKLTERIKK